MDYLKINVLVVSDAKKCVLFVGKKHTQRYLRYKNSKWNRIGPKQINRKWNSVGIQNKAKFIHICNVERKVERIVSVFVYIFIPNHFETDAAFQTDGFTYSFHCYLSHSHSHLLIYPFQAPFAI